LPHHHDEEAHALIYRHEMAKLGERQDDQKDLNESIRINYLLWSLIVMVLEIFIILVYFIV